MADHEHARAQREALTHVGTSSADRARLWAGLNRYLAAETEHEHRLAETERAGDAPADER